LQKKLRSEKWCKKLDPNRNVKIVNSECKRVTEQNCHENNVENDVENIVHEF